MKVVIETASYNERRYGKPWAAFLTDALNRNFEFIDWDGRAGYEGQFIFDAEPGAMIARGQKDNRKGRGGVDAYYIVLPDATLLSTSAVKSSDATLLRLAPEDRWRVCAKERLDYWKERISSDAKSAINCAKYARLLGVPNPHAQVMAEGLGLVAPSSATAQCSTVSLDISAFGV